MPQQRTPTYELSVFLGKVDQEIELGEVESILLGLDHIPFWSQKTLERRQEQRWKDALALLLGVIAPNSFKKSGFGGPETLCTSTPAPKYFFVAHFMYWSRV